MSTSKQSWRGLLSSSLSSEDVERATPSIFESVHKILTIFPQSPLLVYMSIKKEIPSSLFLEQHHSHPIYLPRVEEKELAFYRWQPGQYLEKSRLGILEPEAKDSEKFLSTSFSSSTPPILFAPCVGVHPQGYRLGYGLGFYDRFLSSFPFISCLLFVRKQIASFLPDPHDIPFSLGIHEDGIEFFHPSIGNRFPLLEKCV